MLREPNYFDMVYEEIKMCEPYALLNMFTFEAAIRNPVVKKQLTLIDDATADEQLDALLEGNDEYKDAKEILKKKYLLDYDKYRQYKTQKDSYIQDYSYLLKIHKKLKQDDNIGINRKISLGIVFSRMSKIIQTYKKSNAYNLHLDKGNSKYIHYANLAFYRPMMSIPEQYSVIKIEIPLFQIHKNDFASYFEQLQKNMKNTLADISEYHDSSNSFYNMIKTVKSKAETIAMMFFTWDYVEYYESCNSYTPDYLKRNLCADITEMMMGNVNEGTARSKAEDYLVDMKKLIVNAKYKKFYTAK